MYLTMYVLYYMHVNCSEYSAWMIRHCAVLGLSRVCHACKHHAISESIGSEAWSLLMEKHSTEKDSRVLEAYKMSQVHFTCIYMYIYTDITCTFMAVYCSCLTLYSLGVSRCRWIPADY